MRMMWKRATAALVAVSLATPVSVWGDEAGYCPDYKQVASNATGGDWVAGRLMYETMGSITREEEKVTTTTTTTSGAGVNGGVVSASGSTSTTVTVHSSSETTTAQEPLGYYAMNDGSVYQINCITGKATLLSSGTGGW